MGLEDRSQSCPDPARVSFLRAQGILECTDRSRDACEKAEIALKTIDRFQKAHLANPSSYKVGKLLVHKS